MTREFPAIGRAARAARLALLPAAALGLAALGAPACALIAGLEDHTLEMAGAGGSGTGGMGTGGTGGTGGASSTATTGGTGGTGGSAPAPRGWPDSPTAYCTNASMEVSCPSGGMSAWHGQDGDVRINVPVYETTDKLVTDPITQLTWRRTPLAPQPQASASAFCSSQPYQGFDDWRLPSRLELLSIIDYGSSGARINHAAFPEVTAAPLWSSTPVLDAPSSFWAVDLGCSLACTPDDSGSGNTWSIYGGNPVPALCVRGAPFVAGDFDPPTPGGTITDKSTGLTWQVSTSSGGTNWLGALHTCRDVMNQQEFGGYSDWRLPSFKELQTIVEDAKPTPNGLFPVFQGGSEQYLWSSTPDTDVLSPVRAYLLLLLDGSTRTLSVNANYGYARCVRGP